MFCLTFLLPHGHFCASEVNHLTLSISDPATIRENKLKINKYKTLCEVIVSGQTYITCLFFSKTKRFKLVLFLFTKHLFQSNWHLYYTSLLAVSCRGILFHASMRNMLSSFILLYLCTWTFLFLFNSDNKFSVGFNPETETVISKHRFCASLYVWFIILFSKL